MPNRSKVYGRHWSRSVDIGRDAKFSPALCVCFACCLGLSCELNCVAADQKMCREMIAVSQTKDELGHLCRIAHFFTPIRLQRFNDCTYRWFVIREQPRCIFVRANAPVCPHPTRFEGTHLDAERGDFLRQRLGESANCPLGSVVAGATGTGQTTAHRRDLKDAAALLLAHDWQRSAGHVHDAVEICVHQRLESFGTQLLEGRDVAVSSIINDDIKSAENVHCGLHRFMRRFLVCHIEGRGANLIAMLLHQILKAARVAGGCDKPITRCKHSFSNVPAQTACAASYQPDFIHKTPPFCHGPIICISYIFLSLMLFVKSQILSATV